MPSNFKDFPGIDQDALGEAMTAYGEWGRSFQVLASEIGDYTQRSFESGTTALEKMMAANSVEQAIEIQSEFAQQAYDDYLQQYSRLGNIYTQIAQEAFKPFSQTLQSDR